MKITKSKLKQLVKEELDILREPTQDALDALGAMDAMTVEEKQAWIDALLDQIELERIRQAPPLAPEDAPPVVPVRSWGSRLAEKTIKITKSKLKQLVKEELAKLPGRGPDAPEWYRGPGGVADKLNQLTTDLRQEMDDIYQRLEALEGKNEGALQETAWDKDIYYDNRRTKDDIYET